MYNVQFIACHEKNEDFFFVFYSILGIHGGKWCACAHTHTKWKIYKLKGYNVII